MDKSTEAKIRFADFVEPEIPLLYRVARRLCGNAIDAEDLLQDSLLRAYRAIDSFDGRYPRAWLLTILRNTHINGVKSKRPFLIDDWRSVEAGLNSQASSESQYFEVGISELMVDCFRRLSPEFKEVLYLVDIEGFSYQEAGGLLGIKTATVTSRLGRARSRLRESLLSKRAEGATNEHV